MTKTLLAIGALLPEQMQLLENEYELLRLWKWEDPEALLKQRRHDIVGILCTYNASGVSARLISALPNLEIIVQFGAGMNNIDIESAQYRNIALAYMPDLTCRDTADTALSLILGVSRRIVEADMFTRVGKWHNHAFPLATSLYNKTAGIVGLGHIGREIAGRCEAFGMNIIYHGPREKEGVNYPYYADLPQMARDSHYLVLSCSGGPSTQNLVNERVLKALGDKGYLINVSRGGVVHREDFLISLNNRTIAGAGLDVYWEEPNIPDELVEYDNVVLLPHIGSATRETRTAMGERAIEEFNRHFEGLPLINAF
jgi:lactate dehydrogenase-like 2-hydroxyacid dehydrogenase